MSIQALSWCLKKEIPNPTAKLVLMILCNYANEHNAIQVKTFSKLAGVSDRSIRRCTAQLSDLGLIKIEQRIGTSNLYTILIGWTPMSNPLRTPTTYNTKEDTKVNIKKKGVDKYDQDFQDFWDSYPRKVNKHLAHQKWLIATKDFPTKNLLFVQYDFLMRSKIKRLKKSLYHTQVRG